MIETILGLFFIAMILITIATQRFWLLPRSNSKKKLKSQKLSAEKESVEKVRPNILEAVPYMSDEEVETFYSGDLTTQRVIHLKSQTRLLPQTTNRLLDVEKELDTKIIGKVAQILEEKEPDVVSHDDIYEDLLKVINQVQSQNYNEAESLLSSLSPKLDRVNKELALRSALRQKTEEVAVKYDALCEQFPIVMRYWSKSQEMKKLISSNDIAVYSKFHEFCTILDHSIFAVSLNNPSNTTVVGDFKIHHLIISSLFEETEAYKLAQKYKGEWFFILLKSGKEVYQNEIRVSLGKTYYFSGYDLKEQTRVLTKEEKNVSN